MLEPLRLIIQDVNNAPNIRSALNIVVSRVCDTLQSEVCSIYIVDDTAHQLVLMATQGLNPKAVGVLHLNFDEGIVGLIARREEPINLDDAPNHPNFHYLPEASEEKFHAFLGVPIIHQRKVLGVLVVQQKLPRKFSQEEETFLITLSAQLSGVIASAQQRESFLEHQVIRKVEGIAAAPGVALGQAVVFFPPTDIWAVPDKKAGNIDYEMLRLDKALQLARDEISAMKERMADALGKDELSLFDAYLNILKPNGLAKDVKQQIQKGHWAPGALRRAVAKHVRVFDSMEDEYFRERSTDLVDLARRVLSHLEKEQSSRPKFDTPKILVSEEITASMLAEFPARNILALVSMRGSPTSHAAILAKALGIPAVTGFENVPIARFNDQTLIVDGYQGTLYVSPNEQLVNHYTQLIEEEKALSKSFEKDAHIPCKTTDGFSFPLMVNVGLLADFEQSLLVGADGVGLYRTEIPFLLREQFPSEDEQVKIYRSALKSFNDLPVTFRMLDIGGDKQLPYFPIVEENPFLGWRGIRVTLDHPEIFLIQARAIFKAAQHHPNIRITLPMISSVKEVDDSLLLLRQAYHEVANELENYKTPFPEIGIILEVPSAIYQLAEILQRIQFVSVGSNDLAQYLLAVDRNNTRVSNLYSNYHPALLRAIAKISEECEKQNKPKFVCGEMAGDPLAAIILLGLGFDSLSMNARSIPRVKRMINDISKQQAVELAEHVLNMETSQQINDFLLEKINSKRLLNIVKTDN